MIVDTARTQGIVVRLRTLTVYFWGFLIATATVTVDDPASGVNIAVDGGEPGRAASHHCEHEVHVIEREFDVTN
jgi:hypothetical protein